MRENLLKVVSEPTLLNGITQEIAGAKWQRVGQRPPRKFKPVNQFSPEKPLSAGPKDMSVGNERIRQIPTPLSSSSPADVHLEFSLPLALNVGYLRDSYILESL